MEALPIAGWDHAGLAIANTVRTPWLDSFFLAATWLGSLAVLLPLAVLAWWRLDERSAGFVAMSLAGAAALVHLAKLITARPRPDLFPALIEMPADASFPSAHTMQATAFALGWLLRPGNMPGLVESSILFFVVVLVGMSRLYLQVHFPSDVLAGMLLGILWVFCLRSLVRGRG